MNLKVLSGGAAHGLITALAPQFNAETGAEIDATFAPVGDLREKILSGVSADLLILTSPIIAALTQSGHAVADSAIDIGTVYTGIAVRAGDTVPDISNAENLRRALQSSDAIYAPDPKLATAGIHFANVLKQLGLAEELASRLRIYPNGSAAMRELAAAQAECPIGCTQVTEILTTPGTTFAGALPKEFELATVYTAGISAKAEQPDFARKLSKLLARPDTAQLRRRLGFDI